MFLIVSSTFIDSLHSSCRFDSQVNTVGRKIIARSYGVDFFLIMNSAVAAKTALYLHSLVNTASSDVPSFFLSSFMKIRSEFTNDLSVKKNRTLTVRYI